VLLQPAQCMPETGMVQVSMSVAVLMVFELRER
jgi:hypothetical protein